MLLIDSSSSNEGLQFTGELLQKSLFQTFFDTNRTKNREAQNYAVAAERVAGSSSGGKNRR